MRDKEGRLIGWGMATAIYPAARQPAAAHISLLGNGDVIVQSATHESGTGTYTAMTQIVADTLGLPLNRVRFELGDTAFPPAPVNGGSWLTSSVGPAVVAACEALRKKLVELARADGTFAGVPDEKLVVRDGALTAGDDSPVRIPLAELVNRNGGEPVVADAETKAPESIKKLATFSFGAVFLEVAVDPDLGEIRVSRIASAYHVGRILNPLLARSQIIGGITMGIGAALLEATLPDLATGRMVNANLADYHVPVSTDVPRNENFSVELLDIPDPELDSLGVRGVGEIGIVGTLAAVANAVFHATGKRVRDLPITLDKAM
jgi:xanthine dehydrogenase YagR molybdenum-binding subunit